MKKLFIHSPLFRFLSPIFSGIVAYLLILLINNDIGQLQEQFLGQELYVCIGLSYIIHEFSRLLLWVFKFFPKIVGTFYTLLIQVLISVLLSVGVVFLLITIYYKNVLNYSPSIEELTPFISIYSTIPVSYILLHISHQYLYKINTQKLENELLIKQNIEEDFKQFKREINPNLLFESFEVLLVLIKEDAEKVDEFIDHLATIYRYILSSRKDQLVGIAEEEKVLQELIKLYNHLPYRKVTVDFKKQQDFLIVPGTLLFIVEQIIKTTITSTKIGLAIVIKPTKNNFQITYKKDDKIVDEFTIESIKDIQRVYSIYSEDKIQIDIENSKRVISIPALEIKS